jgi:hypothetical protein
VVTPRVEASPDRSDFAKLAETIALEQTKQFADDIRSQVAEKSRELNFAYSATIRMRTRIASLGNAPSSRVIASPR